MVDRGPEGLRSFAEELHVGAAAAGGTIAAKALVRAAELRLAEADAPARVLEHLSRALALPELSSPLAARCKELQAQAEAQLALAGPALPAARAVEALELAELPVLEAAPRATLYRVLELGPRVLELQAGDGHRRQLPVEQIQAVVVGLIARIPTSRGERTDVLIADLVLDWGRDGGGAELVRLPARGLGLATMYPELPEAEAFARVLGELVERSGASVLPELGALAAGRFERHEGLAEFEVASYGAASAA